MPYPNKSLAPKEGFQAKAAAALAPSTLAEEGWGEGTERLHNVEQFVNIISLIPSSNR